MDTHQMEVCIIIVSYNTKELTRNCLLSVKEKTTGVKYDVFVVDNSSADGSAEMIRKEFPDVRLIESRKNVGFSAGNNIAIQRSDSKYVFLLAPDSILLNDSPGLLFEFMERPESQQIGCCGGALYGSTAEPLSSHGNFRSLASIIRDELHLWKANGIDEGAVILEAIRNHEKRVFKVDYMSGANMFIRRTALDRVGLMDERSFLYFEEAILCYKMRREGFECALFTASEIIHHEGKSPNPFSGSSKSAIFEKSKYVYYLTRYGIPGLFAAALLYSSIYLGKAIAFCIMMEFKKSMGCLRTVKVALISLGLARARESQSFALNES